MLTAVAISSPAPKTIRIMGVFSSRSGFGCHSGVYFFRVMLKVHFRISLVSFSCMKELPSYSFSSSFYPDLNSKDLF